MGGSQAIELFLWLSIIEYDYKISFFLKKIMEILSSSKVTAGKRHFSLIISALFSQIHFVFNEGFLRRHLTKIKFKEKFHLT
jgi:hypothetical protein